VQKVPGKVPVVPGKTARKQGYLEEMRISCLIAVTLLALSAVSSHALVDWMQFLCPTRSELLALGSSCCLSLDRTRKDGTTMAFPPASDGSSSPPMQAVPGADPKPMHARRRRVSHPALAATAATGLVLIAGFVAILISNGGEPGTFLILGILGLVVTGIALVWAIVLAVRMQRGDWTIVLVTGALVLTVLTVGTLPGLLILVFAIWGPSLAPGESQVHVRRRRVSHPILAALVATGLVLTAAFFDSVVGNGDQVNNNLPLLLGIISYGVTLIALVWAIALAVMKSGGWAWAIALVFGTLALSVFTFGSMPGLGIFVFAIWGPSDGSARAT
jgi:hypothetical protein